MGSAYKYYNEKLTQWNKVFLEKLEIGQIVKKFPAFMAPQVIYRNHKSPPPDHVLRQGIRQDRG
jgi:hypothetical protein